MTISSKTQLVRIAALATAVAAIGIAAPSAASAAPAGFTVSGTLQPVPGFSALQIDAQGERVADGKTTGTYRASGRVQNQPLPFAVKGPITCLQVTDRTVSFVYPIEQTEPALIPAPLTNAAAIKVTVTEGVDDQPDRVGLEGPAPTSAFTDCAPGTTPFVFDGDIAIRGS